MNERKVYLNNDVRSIFAVLTAFKDGEATIEEAAQHVIGKVGIIIETYPGLEDAREKIGDITAQMLAAAYSLPEITEEEKEDLEQRKKNHEEANRFWRLKHALGVSLRKRYVRPETIEKMKQRLDIFGPMLAKAGYA